MPTISTALRMADQFSSPLARVITQAEKAAMAMDRLRRTVETPATLRINASSAEQQLRGIERIVRSAKIDVTFNARQTVQRAQMLRRLIQRQLDGIQARIRVELPASLNVMFANLQRLVMKLIAAIRRFRVESGNQADMERRIVELQERISQLQDQINAKNRRAAQSSSGWLSNMKGIIAAYLSIQSLKELGTATIGGAMQQQEMINTFSARTGNNDLGKAIYDQTVKQALKYGQDVQATLGSSMSFMSATMNPKQLNELNKLAMRLSKLNPTEGMEGAAFSLKELLSGDYTSISDRFNISRSALKDSAARMAGMRGDVDGFIKGMDKLLNQQNLTEEAFEKMMDSPAAKWNRAINTFKHNLASAGATGLQSLVPLFDKINHGLETGAFQGAFDMLSAGLEKAVQGLTWFLEKATAVYNFMSSNWSWIEPIIWGVVAAIAEWTIVQWALNIALSANPIGAIVMGIAAAIGAVVFLVKWLINLWNTNDKFAAALIRTWNGIWNFVDQIPIFFTRIGYGIADAFDWAKVESLKIMEGLANGVIDNVNWVIEQLNKIPGVSLDVFDHLSVSGAAAAEAEAKRQAREANLKKMESDAAKKAQEREKAVQKFLNDRASKRAKEQAKKESEENNNWLNGTGGASKFAGLSNDIDKVGKVGQVDKIKDTVDISSEDLKMMRELAEIKSIQNFVTLTPTSIVSFGDTHVKGEEDIYKIKEQVKDAIERELQESISAHAAGIYG